MMLGGPGVMLTDGLAHDGTSAYFDRNVIDINLCELSNSSHKQLFLIHLHNGYF
ncbi:MAG: hypothetical protein ACT4OO_05200 [Nitrospiraceae bacterium]